MRQIADHAGKLVPDVADGLHAGLHHPFLQLGGNQVQPLGGAEEAAVFLVSVNCSTWLRASTSSPTRFITLSSSATSTRIVLLAISRNRSGLSVPRPPQRDGRRCSRPEFRRWAGHRPAPAVDRRHSTSSAGRLSGADQDLAQHGEAPRRSTCTIACCGCRRRIASTGLQLPADKLRAFLVTFFPPRQWQIFSSMWRRNQPWPAGRLRL